MTKWLIYLLRFVLVSFGSVAVYRQVNRRRIRQIPASAAELVIKLAQAPSERRLPF